MYPYAIGLDIGVASVGWAVLALDEKDSPCGIINLGSRIFDAAENPKDGKSLAAPRREARSMRRRLRRHRHRNERIKGLFLASEIVTQEELEHLFDKPLDVYCLRTESLDRLLTRKELARVLIHISQRRGFQSNRKSGADKENGKLLEAVSENAKRMIEGGYRTVGEMMHKDPAFAEHKRNKSGNYLNTVTRAMIEDEVRKIFAAQREFGCSFASVAFENDYLAILLSQRSFDNGPGEPSPYAGNQIERMVGSCTFEPGEMRAAKAAYSFEYFTLLEKVNHLRLVSAGDSRPLTDEQRKKLIELAHKSDSLTFEKIRRELSIPAGTLFNAVHYASESKPEDAEKKEKFNWLKAYHQMRKAIERVSKGSFPCITKEQLNGIGTVLSLYKNEDKINETLTALGIDKAFIDELANLSFSKFGHLSIKACEKITPYLEEGFNYNEACEKAGYDFRGHDKDERSFLLHPKEEDFTDITSPVVKRAVSQTIKVVNAIIRDSGISPTYINIELARELSKDFKERGKIEKDNHENRKLNEDIKREIEETYGKSNPTGQDIIKLKLWKEQDGVCAYSQRHIAPQKLFESGYAEIDHIVPYSISFDDSYKNKVLVLAEENRNKSNRLPLEYLTGKRREDFIVYTNANVKDFRKRRLLLKEKLTDEDINGFKERSLQDTKYAASFMMNYLRDNLIFAPSSIGRKKQVTAVSGAMTAYMRKRWGIAKIREDGDCHHAVDAVVIACTTDRMIQQISRYSIWRECRYSQTGNSSLAIDPETGEVLQEFPYPWPAFRKELEARTASDPARILKDMKLPFYLDDDTPEVKPIFVSRMPKRKVTGAAHKETIKSGKYIDDGFVVVKQPLDKLKLKNGEIENYFDPSSDRLLYDALKDRLAAHGGDGKNAFSEPFHKPKSDGTPGPVVNKVKLVERTTLNVNVLNGTGIADNDSMVRIDVFYVENDGYYFVPIYVADTLKPKLPNKACIAHKPYEQWKEMDENDFIFSLYPNDLIRVEHKKGITLSKIHKESSLPDNYTVLSEYLYYVSAGISSGTITAENHDGSYFIPSLGIKSLKQIEKYNVDVLGNYTLVKREKRQLFHNKKEEDI